MSRLPKLHALLASLVAASAVACGCPAPEDEVVAFDPTAKALQDSFADCQVDALDCDALCLAVYDLMNGEGSSDYVTLTSCELIDLEGTPAVHYTAAVECVGGRLPPGAMLADENCSATETGAWFANLAELEEASVYAFVMLAKELKSFGAPESLVARCLAAAADEVRHAQLVSALAKRFGAKLTPNQVPRLPSDRGLLEVAMENAREGCVRETYGALVAVWQSKHSKDSVVREIMSRIAIDESRHAELSADIDTWARTCLDENGKSELNRERRAALAQLEGSAGYEISNELIELAGLPTAATSAALLAEAREHVWS